MKHFIVTRFNLKNESWKDEDGHYPSLSKEWLNNRFALFEQYCLPSVVNQTYKNFQWVIFFDIDTPNHYLAKIETLATNYKNISPLFIDGFSELNNTFIKYIKRNISEKDKYVITTRLDNDDSIHKDFVKTIQQLYKPQSKTVIDLRLGYQAIIKKTAVEYRKYKAVFNPFISLVSSTRNIETIISQEHEYWKRYPNVITNTNDFLWIQIIHEENKLNRRDLTLKKVYTINQQDFGVQFSVSKNSAWNIILYNLLMSPYRGFNFLKLKLKECIKK